MEVVQGRLAPSNFEEKLLRVTRMQRQGIQEPRVVETNKKQMVASQRGLWSVEGS